MKRDVAEVSVKNTSGEEVGKRALSPRIFGEKTKTDILHQVVRWQRATKRAGTHSTQTRAEMTGGGVKPWKQKGTGRARAGSNTSPLWVGGGIAHGPKPRKYGFSINRQEREFALRSALSTRAGEGRVIVVEELSFKSPKTAEGVKVLKSLGVQSGERVLLVMESMDTATSPVVRSFRNIEGVKICTSRGVNVYDIMDSKFVVFTSKSLDSVEGRLNK